MAKKISIIALIVIALFALGAYDKTQTEYGRYQLICGTVRTDLETTVTQGLDQLGQERYEDRPACIKIDTQTGQTWIYSHEINVITNASGRTRQSTFEGFKQLQ